jgi:hypothetical protein
MGLPRRSAMSTDAHSLGPYDVQGGARDADARAQALRRVPSAPRSGLDAAMRRCPKSGKRHRRLWGRGTRSRRLPAAIWLPVPRFGTPLKTIVDTGS